MAMHKPLADLVADEIARLQGVWRQVACEIDGVRDAVDEFGLQPRVAFSGNSYVVTRANGTVVIEGRFIVDPAQPKAIDWIDTIGADAGKRLPAIYELDENQLVFCAADEGQPRPTTFRTGPGQVMRIHRRETG